MDHELTNTEAVEVINYINDQQFGGQSTALRKAANVLNTHKEGAWIYDKRHGIWVCPICGDNPHKGTGYTPSPDQMREQWRFCNICGADMRKSNGILKRIEE